MLHSCQHTHSILSHLSAPAFTKDFVYGLKSELCFQTYLPEDVEETAKKAKDAELFTKIQNFIEAMCQRSLKVIPPHRAGLCYSPASDEWK